MTNENPYHSLTQDQIKMLMSQGCRSEDWSQVKIADTFDTSRIINAHFLGKVEIGNLTGTTKGLRGLEKPCGIYNATIADCTIGNHTRIANVAVHIANYDIADSVYIENISTMQTNAGATFGNGVEIDVLNEAAGREVVLFDRLGAQFAYIMCLHRYRPKLIEKLKAIANEYVKSVQADRGTIGTGAKICDSREIIDVKMGAYATINGVSSLVNGTILSVKDAPTTVGAEVIAEDFIIAEDSSVTGRALIDKVFVGQGCRLGREFSASNCLFFANSEAFHGEACSIFAGPYTVTHHKSTLLIAGLFSFYNAGSGTNQSNHMYKLGPVHEGKLQRGTKTGSFSYMMWPCRTGPFSVILGKHSSTFDTADFPFSHLEARSDGRCGMVPGLHLTTVGTVRDGAKWPKRDRRKGSIKRDIISFDVLSPYTVGKMIKANAKLKNLQESTDRSVEEVSVGGALVKRPILRSSQKYYRTGINIYLLEKVVEKAQEGLDNTPKKLSDLFTVEPDAVYSTDWVDIGGQLMGKKRLVELEDAIENGTISTIKAIDEQLQKINEAYRKDEWLWVKIMYKKEFGVDLEELTKEDIAVAAGELLKVKSKFLNLVAADAQKEFSDLSRCGFGQDGNEKDAEADFCQTRGLYDENKFVKEIKDDIEKLDRQISYLKQQLSSL
ncbi:DUF4954 family protein [Planctomycetota bacterium]